MTRAVALAGACFLAITPFFWKGIPSGHDFEFHVFSWMEVLGQWKHGIVYPRWAGLAHWGYGEARFLFYPPASWTLGAALGAVLPWWMVPGAYCWIVLTLAGAAMYRLARRWLPAREALFAAVFYAVNPYHLLIVYWRSAYAELLGAALLPLVVLLLLRIWEPGSRADGIHPTFWLSLTLGAAWLINAPAAVMIEYSTAGLALFLAVRSVADKRSSGAGPVRPLIRPLARPLVRPSIRPLFQTVLAIILGAGLASFYLVPAIYEQGWINLSEVMAPGVRPQDNFLFTTIADPDHNRFNLLVSVLAVAEIGMLALGIWGAQRKSRLETASASADKTGKIERAPWMLFAAWGAACVVVMLSVSNLLWQHLPKFRFVQLPFRWLLCLNVALAMLVTLATRRWTSRVLAYAALLVALIVAGHRTQPPWWDTTGDIHEMSDAIDDGSGYEGTDEYVPAGDDAYELNKTLPLVSDEAGAAVKNKMITWAEREKHFTVHADAAKDVTVRLFSYPAWEVVVDGQPTETEKSDVTGLIVISLDKGDHDIQIYLRRTKDRLVGNIITLISLLVFVIAWVMTRQKQLAKNLL
jgi:hypothetical protein